MTVLTSSTLAAMAETCFGCGADNPRGLHFAYRDLDDCAAEIDYTFDEAFSGEPGIVHGGLQATMLDEVLGHVAHRRVAEELGRRATIVTADFELKYRAPCPTLEPVKARARIARIAWPSLFVEGEICSSDGNVLTSATARWRVLD